MNSLLVNKIPSRTSKETTVITTASGKAEATEEATVYVNDLDVFVALMLLAESPAELSLGLVCEGATPMNGKRKSFHN